MGQGHLRSSPPNLMRFFAVTTSPFHGVLTFASPSPWPLLNRVFPEFRLFHAFLNFSTSGWCFPILGKDFRPDSEFPAVNMLYHAPLSLPLRLALYFRIPRSASFRYYPNFHRRKPRSVPRRRQINNRHLPYGIDLNPFPFACSPISVVFSH